jgi:hypothetical protein
MMWLRSREIVIKAIMIDTELSSLLDKTEIYYGDLISESRRAQGFANFRVNPLRPNEMRITLSHLSGDRISVFAEETTFVHEDASFRVSAKIRGQGSFLGDIIEDGVDEFTKLIKYNFATDPIVVLTSFQFFGPLPPILAGRESWPSKINVGGIEITLFEESLIEEKANDVIGTPVKIGYRQGKMEFDLSGAYEESSVKARELADVIDKALSVFSQDRISWHREFSKRYNARHQQINEQELIRRAVQPKGVRTDYRPVGGPLSENIGLLANAIANLPNDKQADFEKFFHCFVYGWLAPNFEIWLIVWHSCLDVFRDYYGHGGARFSANLVKACETAGVSYSDLFTNDRARLLSGAEKFRFNELRDEYVHKGMIVEDFHSTMEQIRNMKALCYRFLLRFLDLDEQFCGLGGTYIP